MVRTWIRIKQSDPDPYQIEKQDQDQNQDRYQSEKQDPDPYQKGLGCLLIRCSTEQRHVWILQWQRTSLATDNFQRLIITRKINV